MHCCHCSNCRISILKYGIQQELKFCTHRLEILHVRSSCRIWNYMQTTSVRNPSVRTMQPIPFNLQSTRFNNCTGMTSLLKFSSTHSSLNRIITLLRDSGSLSVRTPERSSRGISAQTLDNFQLFINSNRYYDVNVDSIEQMFGHFKSAF